MKNIPIPVWLISIYFGSTAVYGLVVYLLAIFGINTDNAELAANLSTYSFFEFTLIISRQILVLIFCFFLLRLKKQALNIALVVLLIDVISLVWFTIKNDIISSVGWLVYLIASVVLVLGVWGIVCIYTQKLNKKLVLS